MQIDRADDGVPLQWFEEQKHFAVPLVWSHQANSQTKKIQEECCNLGDSNEQVAHEIEGLEHGVFAHYLSRHCKEDGDEDVADGKAGGKTQAK